MVQNTVILHSSMANRIIPSISMLKGLLGSNHDVARLLKRCSWFVVSDLEKTLMSNVEILKSCSIPTERILQFIHTEPRCFLAKSDIMWKSVDNAIEIGVSRTTITFIQAVKVFCCMSKGMWELKLQAFRDLGFSDNDIFSMFRKRPLSFLSSRMKMKNVKELLLATGKYNISSIVAFPDALGSSIENRIEPRMQILRLLESKNLIEKWPRLSTLLTFTDDKIFDRFIKPYYNEIGEEHIPMIYVKVRKSRKNDD